VCAVIKDRYCNRLDYIVTASSEIKTLNVRSEEYGSDVTELLLAIFTSKHLNLKICVSDAKTIHLSPA
jgi:dimeric dUTPase (all-alpha-NTP-PPase superfamily)